MLVFDDGDFSEDNTFSAAEIFAHTPVRPFQDRLILLFIYLQNLTDCFEKKSVLSKNLGIDVSAFDNIPSSELFIFPGTKAPADISAQNITGSAGIAPKNESYTYHFSEQEAHEVAGGSVKIIDPLTFPIAKLFSAAVVTVKPGAMREIHWHPSSDEWTFFISGQARATLFTPPNVATTFDYRAGDVAYFPKSNSHYIENVGNEDVVFLEVLQADHFSGKFDTQRARCQHRL